MILRYGSYTHADAEVSVSINKTPTFNGIGQRKGYAERWTVQGILHAADAASLRTALDSLESAYSVDGLDLVLYASDGSSVRHAMRNNGSPQGVRITDFGYPEGDGAEYTTYRTYQFTAEAEYVTNLALDTYSESYEFSGGGERWVLIETITGPPIRQTTQQQTPYRCRQTGNAVGTGGRPAVPPPAFPSAEHTDQRQITYGTPQYLRNGNTMYPVSWSYSFESPTPLFALPPG